MKPDLRSTKSLLALARHAGRALLEMPSDA
jgi:hypothetical protein